MSLENKNYTYSAKEVKDVSYNPKENETKGQQELINSLKEGNIQEAPKIIFMFDLPVNILKKI